jgi:bifunctional ADP-heptose synthase (sugar kinase/adenylyltransferase)
VLGDGIQDIYLRQLGSRPNPEDPTKLALVGDVVWMGGGATNVAQNIVDMGLKCYGWVPKIETKYRILDAASNLVVRFDDATRRPDNINVGALREWILTEGIHCPTVVIADYGKGTITPDLIQMLAEMTCVTFSQFFIDTKRSPQEYSPISEAFGNSCTFLPNRQEYDSYKPLYDNLPSVVRTESEDGVSYLNYGQTVLHVPATSNNVVSVCGAGDTVTAAVAASRANGLSWEQSLNVAMRAAGYVVGKPMTSSVPNGHLLIDYYRKINDKAESARIGAT